MLCKRFIFVSGDEEARNVPPNCTIMVRGLAQHITENDIRQDILSYKLNAKDIRLIRKKETGKLSRKRTHNTFVLITKTSYTFFNFCCMSVLMCSSRGEEPVSVKCK